MKQKHMYDVVIIGSGIAGSALACVLAKNGHKVLIIEKGEHPRFAIGESMLPQTAMWMWIVGEHYGIPELKTLANSKDICEDIGPRCGVKRVIGFVYHRDGERQYDDEGHKLIPPENPLFSESHLFREDVDFYVLKAAIRYGVEYKDLSEIEDLDFSEDEVTVTLKGGEQCHARFLVDGSGGQSQVVKKFGLKEEPTRLKTNSRSMFCHVKGLPPYDQFTKSGQSADRRQWHEGTLHHIFDGGWMWVIPFDNHNKAENTLASIGLMLDASRFPKGKMEPQKEFESIISKYPSIADQMKNIEPVRDWISTGRLQYSCKQSIGHRYALLSSAYGFVDPLYSMGMLISFETVHALAGRLLQALEDDDFSVENFAYIDRLQQAQLDNVDRIVHCAYRSMADFDTWNAWTQYWLASVVFGDTYVLNRCVKYLETGDSSMFDNLEEDPRPGVSAPFAVDMNNIFSKFEAALDERDMNKISGKEAGEKMLAAMRDSEWMPKNIYDWGNSTARHLDFNQVIENWFEWGKTSAPKAFREKLFDFNMPKGMTA